MRAAARARPTAVVLLGVLAVVAVPSAAWAYWTTSGVGVGTVVTGTLDAPTDVRAGATGTDVTVTWTAPTQAYPALSVAYEVQDDGGSTVCSPVSPTATSCSFTAPTGTASYAVSAAFESWTAISEFSDPVTVTSTPTAPPGPISRSTSSPTSPPTSPDTSALTSTPRNSTDDGAATPTSTANGSDEPPDPAAPVDDGVPAPAPAGDAATDPAAGPTAE